MDFSLIGFGINILQKVADFGMGKAQSLAVRKLNQSESILVKQLRANIQPDLDELKKKIESFVQAHLKASIQYVQEALIMTTDTTNIQNIKLVMGTDVCFLDMPVAAKEKLRMAENYAKLVFYDKKNMKPPHRLEAMKMQLFCTMILCQDNPQQCLNLMEFLISLIVDDNELKAAIKKSTWSNIPMIGNKNVIEAMQQFYTELRYGLCSLGALWSKHADFSSIIKTFNNVFLHQDTLEPSRKLGTDGLVLVNTFQGRPVLLAVNSSFHYCADDNLMVLSTFGLPDVVFDLKNLYPMKSTFSICNSTRAQLLFDTNIEMQTETVRRGFNKAKVEVLDSTSHTFNGTGQGKKRRIFKTKKNNVVAMYRDIGTAEDETAEVYQLIVKWGDIKLVSISPLHCDVLICDEETDINDFEIIQVQDSENNNQQIIVDIEAKSSRKQTIFRVMCDRVSGVHFEGIKCYFQSEACHMVRWSEKWHCYEVVEGDAGVIDQITVSRLDEVNNKLYDRASLEPVIAEFLKWNGSRSNFYYEDFLILDNFIFVSIDD